MLWFITSLGGELVSSDSSDECARKSWSFCTNVFNLLSLEKDLKFACGSGHQKGCSSWIIVKWWKEGYLMGSAVMFSLLCPVGFSDRRAWLCPPRHAIRVECTGPLVVTRSGAGSSPQLKGRHRCHHRRSRGKPTIIFVLFSFFFSAFTYSHSSYFNALFCSS